MSNLTWKYEEGIYNLEELCYKYPPPVLVQCDIENSEIPPESAVFDLSQPLLIYRQRNINKVTAHDVQREFYREAGPPLLIPEDYKGWFAVLQKKQRNPLTVKHDVLEFKLISDLSNSDTETFLIGGTEQVQALQVTHFSEGKYQHLPRGLFPGEVLRRGKIYVGETRRKSGLFRRPKLKQEYFLLCTDECDREILLPFNQKGQFFAITTESGRMSCPVLHMKDILHKKYLPATVQLLFGRLPTHATNFTGTLRLEHAHFERSVIACTTSDRNYFVELPITCPLKFRIFEMNDIVISSVMYKRAFAMCNEKAHLYMRSIKVCQEIGVTNQLSDEDFVSEIPPSPHILRKRNPPETPTDDNRESGYIEMRDSLEIPDETTYIDMKDTQSLTSDLALDEDDYVLPTGRTMHDSLRRSASGNNSKHPVMSRQRSIRSPPPSCLPPPLPGACVGTFNRTYFNFDCDTSDESQSNSNISKTSDRIRKVHSERIYDIPRIPRRLSVPDTFMSHGNVKAQSFDSLNEQYQSDAIKYENFSILREVVPKPCRSSNNSPHRRIAEPVEYDLLPSTRVKENGNVTIHEPTNNGSLSELPKPCEKSNNFLLQTYENVETNNRSEVIETVSNDSNKDIQQISECFDQNVFLFPRHLSGDVKNVLQESGSLDNADEISLSLENKSRADTILTESDTNSFGNITDLENTDLNASGMDAPVHNSISGEDNDKSLCLTNKGSVNIAEKSGDIGMECLELETGLSKSIEINEQQIKYVQKNLERPNENIERGSNENGNESACKIIRNINESDDISIPIKSKASPNVCTLEDENLPASDFHLEDDFSGEECQPPPICKNTIQTDEALIINDSSISSETNLTISTKTILDNVSMNTISRNEMAHDSRGRTISATEMNVSEDRICIRSYDISVNDLIPFSTSTISSSTVTEEDLPSSSGVSLQCKLNYDKDHSCHKDTVPMKSEETMNAFNQTDIKSYNEVTEVEGSESNLSDPYTEGIVRNDSNLSDTYIELADMEKDKEKYLLDEISSKNDNNDIRVRVNNVNLQGTNDEIIEDGVSGLKLNDTGFKNDLCHDVAFDTEEDKYYVALYEYESGNGGDNSSDNNNTDNSTLNILEGTEEVQEIILEESNVRNDGEDDELTRMSTDQIVEGFKQLGIRKSVIELVQRLEIKGSDLKDAENIDSVFPGISCIDKRKISMFLQGMMQTSNSVSRKKQANPEPTWV